MTVVLPQDVKIPGTRCTARARGGEQCKKLVVGGGVCRSHGGAAPQVAAKRLQRVAVMRAQIAAQSAMPSGLPAADPVDVLLEELERCRDQVVWLQGLVENENAAPGMDLAATSLWLFQERKQLTEISSSCVRLDLAARREGVLRREADVIERLMVNVLTRIGLDPVRDREVREIVRAELQRAGEAEDRRQLAPMVNLPDPSFRALGRPRLGS